jgi:hypothetical protein
MVRIGLPAALLRASLAAGMVTVREQNDCRLDNQRRKRCSEIRVRAFAGNVKSPSRDDPAILAVSRVLGSVR